jgi:hypothetical protein
MCKKYLFPCAGVIFSNFLHGQLLGCFVKGVEGGGRRGGIYIPELWVLSMDLSESEADAL